MPFQKNRQKTGGRPRGGLNKTTLAGREFAGKLVQRSEYLANVEARAKAGKLHPGVEAMLWYYAHGQAKGAARTVRRRQHARS